MKIVVGDCCAGSGCALPGVAPCPKIFAILVFLSGCVTRAAAETISPRGWKAAMEHESSGAAAALHAAVESFAAPPPPAAPWALFAVVFAVGIVVGYALHAALGRSPARAIALEAAGESEAAGALLRNAAAPTPAASAAVSGSRPYQDAGAVESPTSSLMHGNGLEASPPGAAAAGFTPSQDASEALIPSPSLTRTGLDAGEPSESGFLADLVAASAGTGAGDAAGGSLAAVVARKLVSIDTSAMTLAEQLQVYTVMLQLDYTQHAKRHGVEANALRGSHLNVAAAALGHTVAQDTAAAARLGAAELRKSCSDVMATGVAVMAAAAAHRAWRRGVFAPMVARCGIVPSPTAWGGPLGLWGAWRAAEAGWCYTSGVGEAAAGLAVLAAAPWVVYRTGLLGDYHSMPVAKLLVGLGLGCGAAGHAAVGRLGGDPWTWTALWEVWTLLHVALSVRAARYSLRAVHNGVAGGGPGAALQAGMWGVLGVALPLAMAALPFDPRFALSEAVPQGAGALAVVGCSAVAAALVARFLRL